MLLSEFSGDIFVTFVSFWYFSGKYISPHRFELFYRCKRKPWSRTVSRSSRIPSPTSSAPRYPPMKTMMRSPWQSSAKLRVPRSSRRCCWCIEICKICMCFVFGTRRMYLHWSRSCTPRCAYLFLWCFLFACCYAFWDPLAKFPPTNDSNLFYHHLTLTIHLVPLPGRGRRLPHCGNQEAFVGAAVRETGSLVILQAHEIAGFRGRGDARQIVGVSVQSGQPTGSAGRGWARSH